jgi:hypothetical protein
MDNKEKEELQKMLEKLDAIQINFDGIKSMFDELKQNPILIENHENEMTEKASQNATICNEMICIAKSLII